LIITNPHKAEILDDSIQGTVFVYENNVEIAKINVLANESVEQKSYFDIIGDISNEWAII
jgi:hypothetical protein